MQKLKVITHGGTFHADEVSAIALLKLFYDIDVYRVVLTNKLNDILLSNVYRDIETFVLDVGKEYDPKAGKFDHHQDVDLPATNILILNYLVEQGKVSLPQANRLLDTIFNYISNRDKGIITGPQSENINAVIRLFNVDKENGFNDCVDFMSKYIKCSFEATNIYLDSIELYKSFRKEYVIDDDYSWGWIYMTEECMSWKDEGIKDDIYFAIVESNRVPGEYNVIARNSDLDAIPPHESQKWRHNSGFMAGYASLIEAEDHIKEIFNAPAPKKKTSKDVVVEREKKKEKKKAKYIKTLSDEIIIFPERMSHSDFRELDPVSAGFVDIDENGKYECYGKSIGLSLDSDPEDTKLANEDLFII